MVWLILVATIILLWVISLCKVFYFSRPVSNDAIFSTASGASKMDRNVLIVIAHPDDESMFFSPTILFLASQHYNMHILCISTGNAEGKGEIRVKELYRACAVLKIPQQNIKVLDHLDLQDGFGKPWDHQLLVTIIGNEISNWDINIIITFDAYGVSGHCNHRDVHYGVCKYVSECSSRDIKTWELVSTSVFRKYSGPVDIWMSLFCTLFCPAEHSFCLVNAYPKKCYIAMAEHESQWIWFRKLFVIFSSYSYVNTLKNITS